MSAFEATLKRPFATGMVLLGFAMATAAHAQADDDRFDLICEGGPQTYSVGPYVQNSGNGSQRHIRIWMKEKTYCEVESDKCEKRSFDVSGDQIDLQTQAGLPPDFSFHDIINRQTGKTLTTLNSAQGSMEQTGQCKKVPFGSPTPALF